MAIKAGQLNRLLTVMREVEEDDGYGNYTGTFKPLFNVMAQVNEAKGGDMIRAARVTSKGSVEVRIRQNEQTREITHADRLFDPRFKKTYHIKHIADLEGTGRDFLITCVEFR